MVALPRPVGSGRRPTHGVALFLACVPGERAVLDTNLRSDRPSWILGALIVMIGFMAALLLVVTRASGAGAQAGPAEITIENMTKFSESDIGVPADDFYSFNRIRNPGPPPQNIDDFRITKFHELNTMRIANPGASDLIISDIVLTDSDSEPTPNDAYELPNGEDQSLPLTIAPGESYDLDIRFIDFNGSKRVIEGQIDLISNATNAPTLSATLRGIYMVEPREGNEIDLQSIIDVFGYTTSLNGVVRPGSDYPSVADVESGVHGDLVLAEYWQQADINQPMYGIYLAVFNGQTSAARFIDANGATVGTRPMGFTSNRHWEQSIFPRSGEFGPITSARSNLAVDANGDRIPFRISSNGYSTSGVPRNNPTRLGIRVYRVLDRDGVLVPNSYIVAQDFVESGCGSGPNQGNCDFQDTVMLFTNIEPIDGVFSPYTPPAGAAQGPFGGTAWSLPGSIQAEDYDLGGAGIAFSDVEDLNKGGAYRSDAVDIWATSGEAGFTVGSTRDGEWTEYTVDAGAGGNFDLSLRVASGFAQPGGVQVYVDDALVAEEPQITGSGWWDFSDLQLGSIPLGAGDHVVRVQWTGNGQVNFDRIDLLTTGASTPTPTPTPTPTVPPVVGPTCAGLSQEAEFGQRSGTMDLIDDGLASGGQFVQSRIGTFGRSYPNADIIDFCVNIPATGTYRIDTVGWAPNSGDDSFYVSVDGGAGALWDMEQGVGFVNDSVSDRAGADPMTWALSAGQHTIRFSQREDGAGLDRFEVVAVDVPNAAQGPFGGTAWPVPGRVEAEDYDVGGADVAYSDVEALNKGGAYRTDGVDMWPTFGESGFVIGSTRDSEWTEYTVDASADGTFDATLRVASGFATPGGVQVSVDGVQVYDNPALSSSGWWDFVEVPITGIAMSPGTHVVRVAWTGDGRVNFDRMDFVASSGPPVVDPATPTPTPTAVPAAGQSPFGGSAWFIPGDIEAENYDVGGAGVAFEDSDVANKGGAYRSDPVDIWPTLGGGGFTVGSTRDGEWTEYTVDAGAGGAFDIGVRVATGYTGAGGPGGVRVLVDGTLVGEIDQITGTGWWSFENVQVGQATLGAGLNVIRIEWTGGGNINFDRITVAEAGELVQAAFVPHAIPGVIQAENYDLGGDGLAYFDVDVENLGGELRGDAVDIYATFGEPGFAVGSVRDGEWLEYTVNVDVPGTYELNLRVASGVADAGFVRAYVDGGLVGSRNVVSTGGWWVWEDVMMGQVNLLTGEHIVRVEFANAPALNFDRIEFAVPGSTPAGGDQNFNFQPGLAPVPAGYTLDGGNAFSTRNNGATYGWLDNETSLPLDMTASARDRNAVSDQLLDTLVHMDLSVPAFWEAVVENGTYRVTVGVGDPSNFDSTHEVNVEGAVAVANFTPTSATPHAVGSVIVRVDDGRLTVRQGDGANTKLNYVRIQPKLGLSPEVASVSPTNGETNVATDAAIRTSVYLPTSSIESATANPTTVLLYETADPTVLVPATVNTSGGGDVLVLSPDTDLEPDTDYTFEVTTGVLDLDANAFEPFTSSFRTGSATAFSDSSVSFDRVELEAGTGYTSLMFGPDDKFYASSYTGTIKRWDLQPDGTLTAKQSLDPLDTANLGPRILIGMVFDPASTPENPIAWISHATFGFSDMPDWGGKITRLEGPNFELVEDYVVNLPRSSRDHLTNSLTFGPDGNLYVNQGSNSAMGAPDTAWGDRAERLLSASMLRIDTDAITQPPLDVQTSEGGTYDPTAADAPVQIYATGLRNAYDMVWHSNGNLYVHALPAACDTRIDGQPFVATQSVAQRAINQTQRDFLFRVEEGGYYGHPNPERCEWILNGANPTSAVDGGQVDQYPVGTNVDPNYRGFAFDFGISHSPNGVIEYRSDNFDGVLQGALIITRYSAGDDLIVLWPNDTSGDIARSDSRIASFDPLADPLDIVEDPATGNLYVSELSQTFNNNRLILLRANG